MIFHRYYYANSSSKIDLLKVTEDLKRAIRESGIENGLLTLHVPGNTAGVVLIEEDPKIWEALKEHIVKMIPDEDKKQTPIKRRSGTGSQTAHLRAALLGASLSIPVHNGRLMLGNWQDAVLFDFDEKASRREFAVHIIGDGAE